MSRRGLGILIVALTLSLFYSASYAQSQQITNGLNYLYSVQNPDGSWGNETSEAETLPSTFSVIEAFQTLNQTNTQSYSNGLFWLQNQPVDITEYLSERVHLLSISGTDSNLLISYFDELSYAWGGYDEFDVNNLDTVLALQALKKINHQDQAMLNSALDYLLSTQNSDGGWGFCTGDDSEVYYTSLVSSTLQQFSQTTSIASAISKATSYLLARQNTDGGFGEGGSTVYETAYAFIALVGVTTDNTVLGNALGYLTSTQLTDGSWDEDPYSTALALRALYISESLPAPSSDPMPDPPPTQTPTPTPTPVTGAISGTVIDSSTSGPLSGVAVSLTGVEGSATAVTDSAGSFAVSNLKESQYTLVFTLSGYSAYTATAMIGAGAVLDIGTVSLPSEPATGMVKGTVTDSAGQPLSGVAIAVTGSTSALAETDSSGGYTITGIAPGDITITATMSGYYAASGTTTLTPGMTLTFSPQMSAEPPSITTGTLTGKVYDPTTNTPVESASVVLSGGVSAATDLQGSFLLPDLIPGAYVASIGAAGYASQSFQLLITAGVATDLQTIYLAKTLEATTLTGVASDSATGMPVPLATVTVRETGQSAMTDMSGSYSITGIGVSSFTIDASAAGYDSASYGVTATSYGSYTVNLALTESRRSDLSITSVTTDKQGYSRNETVLISATVENRGAADIGGSVSAEIRDPDGRVIALAFPDDSSLVLAPGAAASYAVVWSTGQFSPGDYSIVLKVQETSGDCSNTSSVLLVEKAAAITLTPSYALGGAISLSPPVAQADMQTPVAIRAAVRNEGNAPINTPLRLSATLNGAEVYAKETVASDLQVNGVIELDLGSFTPAEGGTYSIALAPSDPQIVSAISASLYAGSHVEATFSVSPETAATGNAKVAGRITLRGIGSTSGTVQDPLVSTITSSIQKGVDWELTNAVGWQKGHNCYGCHVQTQTIIGAELSRGKVAVDDSMTNYLLSFMKTAQIADGSVAGSTNGWVQRTSLFAWSLSYYHDPSLIQSSLTKAVDYLITRQNASGYWTSDYYYGSNDWWSDLGSNQPSTPFTAYNIISLAKAYELTSLQKYRDSMLKAADYLKGADYTRSMITAAHIVIGLQTAMPLVEDATVRSAMEDRVGAVISFIESKQNLDGGWGRYQANASDPLPTAHVLYGMSLRGDPDTNSAQRAGATYLIGKQNADGSWSSSFMRVDTYPDRHFGATTWAIISLPVTLETITGQTADLRLGLPPNITLDSSSIAPSAVTWSGDNAVYEWSFEGILEDSMDLGLDLTMTDLQLGEQRLLASQAEVSFKDAYTGGAVSLAMDIPTVTGVSPVSVDASPDKPEYQSSEDMSVSIIATNTSPDIRSPQLVVTVEDASGNVLQTLKEVVLNDLSPAHAPAFMNGWGKRIKMTIDHVRIPSDLTEFPLRLHIGGSSGINDADLTDIFATLGDSRRKIAVTSSDGHAQLYVEIERWDASAKEADLWVKVPSVSASSDVSLYLYYDDRQFDGFNYVGDTTDSAATNVWNNHYKAVYHVANDPSGPAPQVLDSTMNGNHGFSTGSMTSSDLVDGIAGKAVDFDGTNDFADVGKPLPASLRISNAITVDAWIKPRTHGDYGAILACQHDPNQTGYSLMLNRLGGIHFQIGGGKGYWAPFGESTTPIALDKWWHITAVAEPNAQYKIYLDGDLKANWTPGAGPVMFSDNNRFTIGSHNGVRLFNGIIDEISVSDVVRSAAWIKASHYSQNDDLLKWGGVELATNVDPASTLALSYTWNTGSTMAGDYLVRTKLYEAGVFIAGDTAGFRIMPDKTVSSKVNSDKVSYSSGETAAFTSSITSMSTNHVLTDLAVKTTVQDPAGTVLSAETFSVSSLLPGQRSEFKTYWGISTNPPGEYSVTLEVTDSAGVIFSTSSASFTISGAADPSKVLKGEINPDKTVVLSGEPVTASYSVMNTGNEDLSEISLAVLVVGAGDQAVYSSFSNTVSIAMGGAFAESAQLGTAGYGAMDYLVILRAKIGAAEDTLASTYIRVEGAPSAPSLDTPQHGSDVMTLRPALTVNNASDPNQDTIAYEFELYGDGGLSGLILSSGSIAEGEGKTSWSVSSELIENAYYFWRARAFDGMLYGDWMTPAAFRVNTSNEPPSAPAPSSPSDGSAVSTLTPLLAINNSSDPDSSGLTYNFELSLDEGFSQPVASETGIFEGVGTTVWHPLAGEGQGSLVLNENTWYYWHARADDWFDVGPWMQTARFFVNTANDAPSPPSVISPSSGEELTALGADIVAANATDPDSTVLTYAFEIDTSVGFDSTDLLRSDYLSGDASAAWTVSGLRDNTHYYARAKASDGFTESAWSDVTGFFVNTANDAPAAPVPENPSDGSGVTSFTPTLSVRNATDPDGDILTYDFEVYEGGSLAHSLAGVQEAPEITSWTIPGPLAENGVYSWRARAFDGEVYGEWTAASSFMVNTANDAPTAPMLYAPPEGSALDTLTPTLSVHNAMDPDGDSLSYDFEIYEKDLLIHTISSIPHDVSGITSASLTTPLSDNARYTWRARAFDGTLNGPWMDTSTFSIRLPAQNITATIDFDPDTLNKAGNGTWVVVYIELPSGFNVLDVDAASVRLNGAVPAELRPYACGDHDHDGRADLMVKFRRDAAIRLLPAGQEIAVTVTGTVGEVRFEGADVIRVIE